LRPVIDAPSARAARAIPDGKRGLIWTGISSIAGRAGGRIVFRDAGSPSTAPPGAASHQFYEQQQYDGSDRRVDDGADDTGAEMNAQFGQQPAANERADDPDQQITDQPEAGSSNDLTRQPARYNADEQNDDETLT
jgi:hypothetical protein